MTLEQLGQDAHIWIFGSPTALDGERVRGELDAFVGQWKAHGKPVTAAFDLLHDRFVVVGLDGAVDPSGCSIDKLFGMIETLDPALLSDRVYFRDGSGNVAHATRAEFREMKARGEVSAETRVFDLTVQKAGDLRERFETRAAEAWHSRAFGM